MTEPVADVIEEDEAEGFLSKRQVSQTMLQRVIAFGQANDFEKRVAFYKTPTLRQFWGEEPPEIESWKEIFFDLIYVAVAFQLGKVLEELIDEDGGFQSGAFFFAQFLPLYTHWQVRKYYLSRLDADSYFHGLIDIIYATLIALTALFIGKRSDIEDTIGGLPDLGEDDPPLKTSLTFNIALGYSVCSLLACFIQTFRVLEMIYVVRKFGVREDLKPKEIKRRQDAILTSARWDLVSNIFFIVCSLGAILASLIGDSNLFIVSLSLTFFTNIGFLFVFVLIRFCLRYKTQEILPLNINFSIRRMGEFQMLMIGEGVLQIIIEEVGEDLTGHFATFVLSFVLLSFLFVLVFYGLPYEREESAFHKSSIAGLISSFLKPFQCTSLIGVGVSLKLLLKDQADLSDISDLRESLGGFLAFSVFWFLLDRFVNFGYDEVFKKQVLEDKVEYRSWANVNFSRIIFTVMFLFTPLMFFGLIYIELDGPFFLTVALVMFSAIGLVGVIEYKMFLKEIEVEVPSDEIAVEVDQKLDFTATKAEASNRDARSSSVRTNKKSGCKAKDSLQYLRRRTVEMETKMKSACSNKAFDAFDWRQEITDMDKILKIISRSFEEYENIRASKAADI